MHPSDVGRTVAIAIGPEGVLERLSRRQPLSWVISEMGIGIGIVVKKETRFGGNTYCSFALFFFDTCF